MVGDEIGKLVAKAPKLAAVVLLIIGLSAGWLTRGVMFRVKAKITPEKPVECVEELKF